MVDTENSDNYTFFIHQVETAGADILTFDTSSSCQAFAFGDAAGKYALLVFTICNITNLVTFFAKKNNMGNVIFSHFRIFTFVWC